MTWALQDAKNRFSAVAETAAKGHPQVVTRHGRPLVVIISYETYREKISPEPRKNIAEAFMGHARTLRQVKKMKFSHVLRPGETVHFTLTKKTDDEFAYEYRKGDIQCASGVLCF